MTDAETRAVQSAAHALLEAVEYAWARDSHRAARKVKAAMETLQRLGAGNGEKHGG